MINIAIRHDPWSLQVIVSGHAGYAEEGKDIVCAGISTLTNTLANMVRELGEKKLVSLWMVWPDEDPHHIYVETGGNPVINAVMDTFMTEFCQFAGLYPDNVKVQILDEGGDERNENEHTEI